MSTWRQTLNTCYANSNEPGAIHLIRHIKCYFAEDLFSTEIKMALSYLFDESEGLFSLIEKTKLVMEWKTFVMESLDLVAEFTKKYMSEMDDYIAAIIRLSSYNYSAAALRKKAMICLLEVTRGLGHAHYLARIPRFLEEIANLANTGKQYSPSVKEIAFIIIGEMSMNYPEIIEERKIGIWSCFQQVLENGNNPVGLLKGAIIGLNGYLTNFNSVISKPNLERFFSEWILGNPLDNDLLLESVLRLLTKHCNLWTPYLILFYKTKPDRFDRLWQIYEGSDSKRKIAQKAILTVYEILAKCMDSEYGINVRVKLDLKHRLWDNLSETRSHWQRKQSLQILAALKSHSNQLMDPETKKAALLYLEQWIEQTVCEFEEYDMWKMGNSDVSSGEHESFDEEILKTMENASLLVVVSPLLEDCRPETLIRHLVSNQHRCPAARKKRVLVKPILAVNAQLRQIIIQLLINNSCDIVRTANTSMENRYLYLWRELFRIDQDDDEIATPKCVSETFRMYLVAAVQSLEILDCSDVAELDFDTNNKPENETLEFVANVCHLTTEILNFDTIDEYLLENNLDILRNLIDKCLYMDETIYQYGDPTSCAAGVCELIGELSRVVYRTMKTDSQNFEGCGISPKIEHFYMKLTDKNRYKTETIFANAKTSLMIPARVSLMMFTKENYIQINKALKIVLNYPKKDLGVLLQVLSNVNEIIDAHSSGKSIQEHLNSLKPEFINILNNLASEKPDMLHRNIKWHVLKIVGSLDTQTVEKEYDWSKDTNIGLGFNFNQWRSCSESLMLLVPCPGRGDLKIYLDELSGHILRNGDVSTLQSIALLFCCAVHNSDTNTEPVFVSRTAYVVRELARRGDDLAARISRWMVSKDGARREIYIQSMMKYTREETDPLTIEVCVESLGVCCRHEPQCLNLIVQNLYTLDVDSIEDTQSKMIVIKTITPILAENEDLLKDNASKLLHYTVTSRQSIQSYEAFDALARLVTEKRAIFEKNYLITILTKLTKFTFKNMKSFENISKKVIAFGKKNMKSVKLETWIDFTSATNTLQRNVQILSEEFKKYMATFNEKEFISLCEMLRVILRLQRVLSKNLQERDEYVHIFNSFNTGVCMETILSSIVNVLSRRDIKISIFHEIYAFLEVNSVLLTSKWMSETSWILMNLLHKHPTENFDTSQISILKRCFLCYKDIWAEKSECWSQFETKFKSKNYILIENLKSVAQELNNLLRIRNHKIEDEIVDSVRRLILFEECISLFMVQDSVYDAETQEMTDLNIDKSFKECITLIATEETLKWYEILTNIEDASNELITGVNGRFVKDIVHLALKVNGDTLLRKVMSLGIDSKDVLDESNFLSTFNIEIAQWMLESGRTICIEVLDCGAGVRVAGVADVLLRYCLTQDAQREHQKMVLEVVSQKWPVIASSASKISRQIELLKLVAHIAQDISCEPGIEPLTWILKQMCSDSTSPAVKIQLVELLPTFVMQEASEGNHGDDMRNAMRSYSALGSARAIQTLARVCSTSGHPLLVEALVQMVIVCSNSVIHDAALIGAMRTLGARGLSALPPLRVLCDATLGVQDAKARLTVLERLCSPLLLWSSPQCCEKLFTEFWPRLEKVVMFKLKPGAILNESEFRINMTFVSYVAAYTILELLIAKLPRESLMSATSALSQLVVPENRSNWALTKRICTICSTWRRSSEAPANTAALDVKENYRRFQCAVYRCFAAAICRMQPALKFYDRQFSKEVWPLIVGDGTTYSPKPFFVKKSLPRTVAVSTDSSCRRSRGTSSSLSRTSLSQSCGGSLRRRLFFQTLSDDVFQYDFLNLDVDEEGGNSGETNAPSSVKLEHSEGWNQHECMAVLVSMIEDLATRTNDTTEYDDRGWLENLVKGLNDDSMVTAPRRFLAQVVSNCRVSLKKFANSLRIPLLRAVLHNKERQTSTLDSVDLDMFRTLVEWSDTQLSESEMSSEEKQLVQLAAHLLVQSASQGSLVSTQTTALLKQLAPKWKLQTLAPTAALLQLLQSVTAKKTGLSMCIILLPYLLISQSDELRRHLMELVKNSQTTKLAAEAFGACFGGERKRGVHSSELTRYVDDIMQGSDIERINLLFHMQKYCLDICSRNYFNWIISMTPKVPMAVKKTCLKIIATHLGSALSEPLLCEDISALMVTLNPAVMLEDGTDGYAIYVLEIVKNVLRFPIDGWHPHVQAVCDLLSRKDQKGSEEIRREGYQVILAAFDRIMGIETDGSTSLIKSSQTFLLSLADFTDGNVFVRRLASILASALLDEDIDISDTIFSSLSARLSSTKFIDLRFMESFLLLILIPLSDISEQYNANNSVPTHCRNVAELATFTRLVLDACRDSVEYKEAKLRMVPLLLEPDTHTAAGSLTMLSYTTVHKSVRYIASFSVTGMSTAKARKKKLCARIQHNETSSEVYPNVVVSLDSVIQPLLQSKDINHSSVVLFVCIFKSILNKEGTDLSQRLSPLILRSISYMNQSAIRDAILLHALLEVFRLCVRHIERSETTETMFKCLRQKYKGLGLDDLMRLVMEEVEIFGRDVNNDLGQPSSKKLRLEEPSSTKVDISSDAAYSQDTFSIAESTKLMELLADWDTLTRKDKRQNIDSMPNIWTNSEQFVTRLDEYFAHENRDKTSAGMWDWLEYGHQLLKGNNPYSAQNWLRKSQWPCTEFNLKAMLELSEWEIAYQSLTQSPDSDSVTTRRFTDAISPTRETFIPSAMFLMLRKSLIENLPSPFDDTMTQESNSTSEKLLEQRSREIDWIQQALDLGLWKQAEQCIERNSINLTNEEYLKWFLLRSRCVILKAFHLGARDTLHSHTLASHMTLAISSLKDLSEFSPLNTVLEMKAQIKHLVAEFGVATVERVGDLDGLGDSILEIIGESKGDNLLQNYAECVLNTLRNAYYISPEQAQLAIAGQMEANRRLLHYFDAVLEIGVVDDIDLQHRLRIELVRTAVSCIKQGGDVVPVISLLLNRIQQSHFDGWEDALILFNEEIKTIATSNLIPTWPYLLPCIPNTSQAVAEICMRIAMEFSALVSQEYRTWRRDLCPDVSKLMNGSTCDSILKSLDAILLNGAGQSVLPDEALISVCNPLSVLNNFCHQLHQYTLHYNTQKQITEEIWNGILSDMNRDLFQGLSTRGSAFQLLEEYQQKLQQIPSYGASNFKATTVKILVPTIEKIERQLSVDGTSIISLNYLSPVLAYYKGDGKVPEQLSQFLSGMGSVTIVGFLKDVHVMRGAKCQPVVLSARLSNGRVLRILLKRAEWQQDRLVQYTQTLMNQMLTISFNCTMHKIKTYKVVPLRKDVVAMEWLDGCCTLRQLACMHSLHLDKIREEYANIPDDALVEMSRVAAVDRYQRAAARVPRYHIRSAIEITSSSVEDFIKHKRTFVESLAVMSIVHWILGLGDRHLSNFLYNASQGWVCGVDSERTLGSAVCHQRSPELVPARLTPQLCAVTQGKEFRIIMEETLSVFRLRWRELFASISLLCISSAIDEELFTKISRLKRKLNGQLNSFEVTTEELDYNKLINPALYKQFLDYVKPVYESGFPYTVAEQVNCVLIQSTAPEILGITRNGLEPWI